MECNTIVFSPAVIMHIFHCGCTLQIYTGIFTIITIYVKNYESQKTTTIRFRPWWSYSRNVSMTTDPVPSGGSSSTDTGGREKANGFCKVEVL
jgi:hypothetical protein